MPRRRIGATPLTNTEKARRYRERHRLMAAELKHKNEDSEIKSELIIYKIMWEQVKKFAPNITDMIEELTRSEADKLIKSWEPEIKAAADAERIKAARENRLCNSLSTCIEIYNLLCQEKEKLRINIELLNEYKEEQIYPLIEQLKPRSGSRGGETDKMWQIAVLRRDGHKCRMCGVTDIPSYDDIDKFDDDYERLFLKEGVTLHIHHIMPYSLYPEIAWDIDNGITLCEKCHYKTYQHELEHAPKLKALLQIT